MRNRLKNVCAIISENFVQLKQLLGKFFLLLQLFFLHIISHGKVYEKFQLIAVTFLILIADNQNFKMKICFLILFVFIFLIDGLASERSARGVNLINRKILSAFEREKNYGFDLNENFDETGEASRTESLSQSCVNGRCRSVSCVNGICIDREENSSEVTTSVTKSTSKCVNGICKTIQCVDGVCTAISHFDHEEF